MPECSDCGREFDETDSFCPSCGKQAIKKFNPIILSKKDYDEVRSNKNYDKCEGCGALIYHTYTKCPKCQKDMPKIKRGESRDPVEGGERKKRSGISGIVSNGINDIIIMGVDAFKGLPRNYQFGFFAVILILLGAVVPWGAVGLDMVGSVLILAGLVLILVTGGLFKKLGSKKGT